MTLKKIHLTISDVMDSQKPKEISKVTSLANTMKDIQNTRFKPIHHSNSLRLINVTDCLHHQSTNTRSNKMDNAKCMENGVIYSALNFSGLPTDDLDRMRRLLQCSECGGPAFFRHASPIGRAACFGARPHVHGCQQAALDYAAEDPFLRQNHGDKIIVDFNYGASIQGYCPDSENTFTHDRYRPSGSTCHRRLSPLLRTLIESPTFSCSSHTVEVEGHIEMAAKDLFVPLQCARSELSGHYRGFFGVISDAKVAPDNSLWFNSGGNDNISFCLDSRYVGTMLQRYRITDLEDIAGAYILVFGTLKVSQNGKLFCLIDSPECMAFRLT
ncbi:MAG: hypothetical protein WAT12_12310 [Candidatus Nitrotoga sp.]